MLSKTHGALAALGATLLSFGVVANGASANWFIEKTGLKEHETAALASTASVDENLVLSASGLGLKITCTGLSQTKAELDGGTELGQASALVQEGCSVTEPATCSLSSSKITSEAVLAEELPFENPDSKVIFSPQKGTTLALLTLEGGSCALAGKKSVEGLASFNAPKLQESFTTQSIEALGEKEHEYNTSLTVAGQAAHFLKGKALLKLASGKAFSGSNGINVPALISISPAGTHQELLTNSTGVNQSLEELTLYGPGRGEFTAAETNANECKPFANLGHCKVSVTLLTGGVGEFLALLRYKFNSGLVFWSNVKGTR
jgi:hypothetical protein